VVWGYLVGIRDPIILEVGTCQFLGNLHLDISRLA
jgi:hypothetical protein